jgi:hypothetical protein
MGYFFGKEEGEERRTIFCGEIERKVYFVIPHPSI